MNSSFINILQYVQSLAKPIYLAYSGGVDSQVLFDLLIKQHIQFTAIHINHGLNKKSNQWQSWCEQQCEIHKVEFLTAKVSFSTEKLGIEAAAREARYAAFSQLMLPNSVLFTAHHQDDQVETFFLKLSRGASLKGLSGLKVESAREHYLLIRPLLSVDKQSILDYAKQQQLTWLEDDSNENNEFDRNFLRNQVLPILSQRWPHFFSNVTKSMQSIFAGYELEKEHFKRLLGERVSQTQNLISLDLNQLERGRQQRLIFYFALYRLQKSLPANIILSLMQLIQTQTQFKARVEFDQLQFFADGQTLHVMQKGLLDQVISWPERCELGVNYCLGLFVSVQLQKSKKLNKAGLRGDLDPSLITIAPRGENQDFEHWERQGSRSVKKLINEIKLPWYVKKQLPFIYFDGQLIAIANFYINRNFVAKEGHEGIEIDLTLR